jgi:hypothetical protein
MGIAAAPRIAQLRIWGSRPLRIGKYILLGEKPCGNASGRPGLGKSIKQPPQMTQINQTNITMSRTRQKNRNTAKLHPQNIESVPCSSFFENYTTYSALRKSILKTKQYKHVPFSSENAMGPWAHWAHEPMGPWAHWPTKIDENQGTSAKISENPRTTMKINEHPRKSANIYEHP